MRVLLQTAEVAKIADCTPAGVRLAVKMGQLRVTAITGRGQHLFTRKDALAWNRRRLQRRRTAAGGAA